MTTTTQQQTQEPDVQFRPRDWPIWTEGYDLGGTVIPAEYWGTYRAPTFKDAVLAAVAASPLATAVFNRDRLALSDGRRFFWNEQAARRKEKALAAAAG